MNSKLQSALNTLNDLEYYQLCRRLDIAQWCRGIMLKYELLDADMAKKLGLTPKRFKHFKFGALDYSIMDLSKLQAIEMELGMEALRDKVASRVQIPK